ncbi:MAG: hypothetical protein V2J20_06315, partial [Wenzhouxiangella sp.]|nr:hypothetical protein [Wenzhouxiangella sp.]
MTSQVTVGWVAVQLPDGEPVTVYDWAFVTESHAMVAVVPFKVAVTLFGGFGRFALVVMEIESSDQVDVPAALVA